MRHFFLDHYSELQSPIHDLDSRIKAILAFMIVLYTVETPTGRYLDLIFILPLLIIGWYLSSLPFNLLLKRVLSILPFILIISIGIVITKPRGLENLLSISIKGALAIWTLTLLAATTPFPSFLKALQSIGCPQLLLNILNFMYRYIFLFIDEYERLQIGRNARSFVNATFLRFKGISWMLGTLFLQSFERASRIYQAMQSKGFEGRFVILKGERIGTNDILIFTLIALVLIFGKYLGHIYG